MDGCHWTDGPDASERKGLLQVDVCGEDSSDSQEWDAQAERTWLPACFYDGGEILWTSHSVGPAIPWLWALNIALIIHSALFFILVLLARSCTSGSSYPAAPVWIVVVAVSLLPLQLLAEYQCLCAVLATFTKDMMQWHPTGARFTVMTVPVPVGVWVLYCMSLSTLFFADLLTDSNFSGTMSFSGAEMCSDQTDKIWGYWWEHSVVGMIGVPPVPLDHLVFICWLLTFLQQVVPCATMVRSDRVAYERSNDGKSKALLTGQQLYNDDVFFELGTAAGLHSITLISTNCRWCHVKRLCQTQPWRVMGYAKPLAEQLTKKFFLSYFLEPAVQLNLQACILAINRYQMGYFALVPALSLGLSMFTTALNLAEMRTFFRLWQELGTIVEKAKQHPDIPKEAVPKLEAGLSLWCHRGIYVGVIFLVAAATLFTAGLTIFGAHQCPHGLITLFGCLHRVS
ncbi:unnamed protein product [Durusdinium trenchii]|uniref:Glycerophosphocholine acyltransferase 1 n=1 Tax=Durusdinium trenchii TaxID=1381693 RepID=A0ABP0KJ56_9DINO